MPLKKTTVGWADYTWELPQTGRDSPQWAGALRSPLEMTVPKRILLDANSHLFCDRVPDEQVREIWALMRDTLRHTFLVLTDSPDVMAKTTKRLFLDSRTDGLRNRIHPNIWLGVRVDGQDTADSRIPQLYAIDCDVRFAVARNPQGPIDLECDTWERLPTFPYDDEEYFVHTLECDLDCDLDCDGGVATYGLPLSWVVLQDATPEYTVSALSLRHQSLRMEIPFYSSAQDIPAGGPYREYPSARREE